MGCTNHPAVEAGLQQCWVCAKPYCPECVVEFQGRTVCAPCKSAAVARLEGGASTAMDGEGEAAPWERRSELGLVPAFMATCKAAMLEPTRFFSRLDRSRTTYDCLFFIVIINVLVAISGALTQFLMYSVLGISQGAAPDNPIMAMFMAGSGVIGIVIAPIIGVIQAFLGAGFIHVALLVMKKATVPYHQTLRGYCYASAANIIGVVPLVGAYAGAVWALISEILMVKERHRCSGGTATIAVLWIVGLCMCGILLLIVFGAAGMMMSQHR